MGNRNSNFPQMQLEQLDKPAVQEMVSDLRQLYDMGRPKTDEELKQSYKRANLKFIVKMHKK